MASGGFFDILDRVNGDQEMAKALARYREEQQKKEFNDGALSFLSDQSDPTGKPYIQPEFLAKWHSLNPDKQAGYLSLAAGKYQEDLKAAHQRQQQETLNLSPEEQANYSSAGKIPLRQSRGSFQAADMPDAESPDTDASGNPIYSKDGLMYKSGGKFKPITGPMMQAKLTFEAMHPAVQAAAQQSGFKLFAPSTWFGAAAAPKAGAAPAQDSASGLPVDIPPATGSAAPVTAVPTGPAAAATPVRVNSPEEANALPPGTVFITPDGRLKRRP